jgi:hypothetical protein
MVVDRIQLNTPIALPGISPLPCLLLWHTQLLKVLNLNSRPILVYTIIINNSLPLFLKSGIITRFANGLKIGRSVIIEIKKITQ